MVIGMKINAKSVIYCRVSSQAQLKKGDGLASQETRCREYARQRGYRVEAVFYDEGISGKLLDRAKMREMLDFLKKHGKKEPIAVIIDDISRLARDLETHIKLRTAIADAGGKLESPTIEFGEDSDSRLVEHLLASVAAHQREKNAEQVKNRMRARVQNGYWVFMPPVGYRYERLNGSGKVLVKDATLAPIVKNVLEGFACGRFETQTEILRYLESQPDYPRDRFGSIHITRVTEMLERVLYTGYMEYKPWGIPLQKGKHEAIISFETFNQIQERLRGKAQQPNRRGIGEEFPLRGYVACATCGKPMTSCWSAGRSSRYPYYLCRNKDCPENKKSIKRDLMEEQFEELLYEATPTPDMVCMLRTGVKQIWQQHYVDFENRHHALERNLRDLDIKIEQFMDRIIEAESGAVIRAYETKIAKLENEKIIMREKLAFAEEAPTDFETSFQTVFDFIENPQKLWHSEDIEHKRIVLKLTFARPLQYRRNEGFQTAALALPFAVLRDFSNGKSGMVERLRLGTKKYQFQTREHFSY